MQTSELMRVVRAVSERMRMPLSMQLCRSFARLSRRLLEQSVLRSMLCSAQLPNRSSATETDHPRSRRKTVLVWAEMQQQRVGKTTPVREVLREEQGERTVREKHRLCPLLSSASRHRHRLLRLLSPTLSSPSTRRPCNKEHAKPALPLHPRQALRLPPYRLPRLPCRSRRW